MAADFLVPARPQQGCEAFVLAAVHVGLVTVFLYISSKTNIVLCSVNLFIYLFIYGCVGSSFLCEGFL